MGELSEPMNPFAVTFYTTLDIRDANSFGEGGGDNAHNPSERISLKSGPNALFIFFNE